MAGRTGICERKVVSDNQGRAPFRYNTLTHEWEPIPKMNTSRAWHAVAVVDKRIYVMGGFDGTNRLRSVECYDPDTQEWTFISQMKRERAGCGAAAL